MSQATFDFFFDYAGYSYNPEKESEFAGRVRCATELTRARFLAWDRGYTFEWSVDPVSNSSEWSDEEPPYAVWNCLMRDSDGHVVQSLSCIDFGRDIEPWGQPYKQVVEAELAVEQLL